MNKILIRFDRLRFDLIIEYTVNQPHFSYTSVQSWAGPNNTRICGFDKDKLFIILDFDWTVNKNLSLSRLSQFISIVGSKGSRWKPVVLIPIFGTEIHNTSASTFLENVFRDVSSIRYDEGLYPIFMNDVGGKLRLSVWEVYDIKRKRIIASVHEYKFQEGLEYISTQSFVDGFARRRINLHLENFTASVELQEHYDAIVRDDSNTTYDSIIYQDLKRIMNFRFAEINRTFIQNWVKLFVKFSVT